jgi:hypothetical protein
MLPSSDTLYHVIPGADSDADASQIELAEDSGVYHVLHPIDSSPPLTDTRVLWVYFILGAAVLLPWNGISLFSEPILEN